MESSLTISQTTSLLARIGVQPKKALGQNFLIDKNIVKKSLELAGVKGGGVAVEVGPGLGTLTTALLNAGLTVYAIEKDPKLYEYLKDSVLPNYEGKLFLRCGDALDYPLADLPEEFEYQIIANLPYAISTPWLEGVLSKHLPTTMTLMLQKEAANRFNAKCHTKQYSPISIFLNAAFEIISSYKVSRSCFFPVPGVDSVLLHVEKRANAYIFTTKGKSLIRDIFTQRRKQLQSLAKQYEIPEAWLEYLRAQSIALSSRAEDIGLPHWIILDEILLRS